MVSEAPMASGAILTAALCKKRNRVARVLAYALLEWILIALLLANGVFSYLISRFAAFFGLAPPCALCSRLGVDSLFESHQQHRGEGGGAEPLRRVLCDAHAAEVSRLGYCRAHRRLADAGDMCEDCASAAVPGKALLSWMRRSEQGERDLACACCGVPLESGFYSPSFLLPKPAARNLDCSYREEAVASLSGDVVFASEEGPLIELFDEKPLVEDDSIGVMAVHCANTVGNVGRLVPLESNDLLAVSMAAVSSQSSGEGKEAIYQGIAEPGYVVPESTVNANEEKFLVNSDDEKVDDMVDRLIDEDIAALVVLPVCIEDGFDNEINTGESVERLTDQQPFEDDSGLRDKEQETSIGKEISEDEQVQQGALKKELFSMPTDPWEHEFVACASETSNENTEGKKVQEAELDEESDSVQIYTREHADEEFGEDKITQVELKQEFDSLAIDSRKQVHLTSNENTEEKSVEQAELKRGYTFMTAGVLEHVIDSFDGNIETDDVEVDPTEAAPPSLHQISHRPSTSLDNLSPGYNDIEDGGAPDTPIHIEGISDIQELPGHKAMCSDAKSIDSSVATMSTEMESIELVSVDQLKSALVAARKSLNTLYAELDNERSAAAIAADETMAMINRLQEQKAAMQMEAIQYQRLMEEQSEYDQEALQRLNELIVKREKEKQDLERELELYRHKVHLYETKERRRMSRHKADDQNGSSSASSSAEDSDDLSQSFYEGDESAHGLNGSNGSIPTDVVLRETARHLVTLDGPLADFEEERLSILEQLKVLEERLFDLEDEESDNMKMDKQFSPKNHLSGAANGFSDEDGSLKLHEKRKGVSYRGKKLLPLFDDATVENGNGVLPKQDAKVDDSAEVVLELSKEQDKLAIANEIDHVHERLHALEADREFIKQCVRSLNKGGKGFDLLQEILQHLRDLRRIEHARKPGDLSPYYRHPYTD